MRCTWIASFFRMKANFDFFQWDFKALNKKFHMCHARLIQNPRRHVSLRKCSCAQKLLLLPLICDICLITKILRLYCKCSIQLQLNIFVVTIFEPEGSSFQWKLSTAENFPLLKTVENGARNTSYSYKWTSNEKTNTALIVVKRELHL